MQLINETMKDFCVLFDALLPPFSILNSNIAHKDGRVYERIIEYLYSKPEHFGKNPNWD